MVVDSCGLVWTRVVAVAVADEGNEGLQRAAKPRQQSFVTIPPTQITYITSSRSAFNTHAWEQPVSGPIIQ